MCRGSLTLRVKVPRDRGTREYPSRPRGVRGRDPLGDKNPSRVSPKADGGLQAAARDSLADSPREVLVGGPAAESELQRG